MGRGASVRATNLVSSCVAFSRFSAVHYNRAKMCMFTDLLEPMYNFLETSDSSYKSDDD